ncbi:tyrosine--tRNA ligase [Nocardioides lentus]|uniref:Tyrosine--tRNA ligase n=1 Tax=Nocardioides lentus TaxID=338077 RepID=A0ABN2PRY0_9ACTN
MTTPSLLDDLEWRGLIAHSTDRDALRAALDGGGSVRFYVGFDPTAPSLHMGHLVQVLTARRLQQAGHTPYALVGGATGMIGDPRDSGERTLNPAETVAEWVGRVRAQIEPFLSFEGDNAATMVNNLDWTEGLSTIDFLRDVGKHFPVNRMLARDTVKRRLEAGGISYTEFSYVLLQSWDFLSLHRRHGVTLQFGGSDQWGNLTGGAELVRRADGATVHAFATPLLTKADGTKYGKTEGGALWLDPRMLSPYAFYQFWLNVEDEKLPELLRVFTFLSREEIEALDAETAERPFRRAGQKALAEHVTTLVHGAEETARIQAASAALFGGGELQALDPGTLGAALTEVGATSVPGGPIPPVVDLLVASGLSRSKGEARRTVGEGGAYLNNTRVEDPELVPTPADLLGGRWLVLRRGKKNLAAVEVG